MKKLYIRDPWQWISDYRSMILEKIPNGMLTPEHTDTHHFYRFAPTDELMSSCTAPLNIISDEHLKAWAAGIAADYIIDNYDKFEDKQELKRFATEEHHRIFRDAGDVGTKIHDVCEVYCKQWIKDQKRPDDIRKFIHPKEDDMRVFAGTRSFEKYMVDSGALPVFAELIVANPKIRIAGQLDLILLIPVKDQEDVYELVLADLKTSNQIAKDTYALQTAQYYVSFKELTGEKLHRVIIIQLDKVKCKYTIGDVPHIRKSMAIYKHALAIYRWKQDMNAKKVIVREHKNLNV